MQRDVSTVEDIEQMKAGGPVTDYDFSPEEERQVLRKIDRVVLPVMAIVYFFQCKPARPF